MRSDAPAQWVVEPPTAFTIQAGRLAKSLATRQLPDVVRMSDHASWVKLSHSSLTKSWFSMRAPASRMTTAASFTPADLRFAWVGVMAGIAGLAALLLLGWSEIEVDPVSATERRADPSSLATGPRVETQAERMEAIRRRGLELLRADFPEDEPSPSLARGDRLELHDATIKPDIRIATAGEDGGSIVPPAPERPAASKPAEAKEKRAVEERPAHRRHARRASRQ